MRCIFNITMLAPLLCIMSCGTSNQFSSNTGNKQLLKAITSGEIFSDHHTGFALYDPQMDKWLCRYNADKYFTPASNTKILTLLTCLHVLSDSIETLRYAVSNDSLYFKGLGDPSFLFAEISSSTEPLEILRQHKGTLIYLAGEEIDHFGPGWAWDDYPYAFQVEKSALPIYGNRLQVTKDAFGEIAVIPAYFSDYIELDTTQHAVLSRDPIANAFVLNPVKLDAGDTVAVPFVVSDYEITRILADVLDRPVNLSYQDFNTEHWQSVFSTSRDTLLKRLMQESDNMIAEQLLMQCAFYMRATMDTDSAISVAQNMILGAVPDPVQWVDGSGLSRYNLMTPRSIVAILEQIAKLQSMDYVTRIFPAGGQSGTIENWYKSDPPFVFAKTGTLRNNHCLSGYILTDRGKWLIFSFMHNNFTVNSSEIKKEMERVLLKIKEKY